MSFPIDLTSVLSGASVSQLRRWRSTNLLIPEVNPARPPLYSFRDVVALRTLVRLRADTSLQKIRSAIKRLPDYDLTDHVSAYLFAVRGKSIVVETDSGWLDLINNPGQYELYNLARIYEPFMTKTGVRVVDFRNPRPNLEVNANRVGGWPVLKNTRIGYDIVAAIVDNHTIFPRDIERFYPGATEAATLDALSFDEEVRSKVRKVA
ncbi:MAG: hypothetical protein FWF43_05320 [Propionibacteriaceae bacterium]|nr:hypothetical protein [Propionibacteriaceae bacterium]